MKAYKCVLYCMCGQSITVVKFLLQWGETALHKAVLGGHVEVVKTLVDHGAAVDVRNKV